MRPRRKYVIAPHPGNGPGTQWEFRWVALTEANQLRESGWRVVGVSSYGSDRRSVLIRREMGTDTQLELFS